MVKDETTKNSKKYSPNQKYTAIQDMMVKKIILQY